VDSASSGILARGIGVGSGVGVGVGDAAEGDGCGAATAPGQEDAKNNRIKKITTRCIE
jgi:hypothetical protein